MSAIGVTWALDHPAITLVLAVILYLLSLSVHRLYFSPLAKFPGPKLAAVSAWYAAYYDLVKGGRYIWEVEAMHQKYGPIVRVRPDVLHVNDPSFIEKLYSQSPKHRRERYRTIVQTLQAPGSILASVDHDLHRRRRSVLNPYFSQQNVRRLEPVINQTLANMLYRMEGWAQAGTPIHMNKVYRAATKDVIQAYAFGDGQRCLDMDDCNAAFFDVITPQRVVHLGTYVYWLAYFMANLPPKLMLAIIPRVGVFAEFMQGLEVSIEEIRQAKELPEGKTIFHEIMRSDIPDSEKGTRRLADEAMVIVIAGSETTAATLVALTYRLLSEPKLLKRLKQELETAIPDPNGLPQASKLDGLPFLNALIEEAIRFYPGATHRQDRIAPDEDLVYEYPDGRTVIVPAGTPIGMTAPLLNRHPSIYDRPDEFLPDRYIDNPLLRKYQFAFSKGTRQCIGINLAYQELQTFTAGIFRKYSCYDPTKKEQAGPTLELYHTEHKDVELDRDYITPAPYVGSEGLRLIIRQ